MTAARQGRRDDNATKSGAAGSGRTRRRPFFRHLPRWIYESSEYADLNSSELWGLHMIAAKCDQQADDAGSIRGCFCGGPLPNAVGCSDRTFARMAKKLARVGFVVKVGQGGGGGNGNELAVPGADGVLDHLDVGDDERFHRPRTTQTICQGGPRQSVTSTQTICLPFIIIIP